MSLLTITIEVEIPTPSGGEEDDLRAILAAEAPEYVNEALATVFGDDAEKSKITRISFLTI